MNSRFTGSEELAPLVATIASKAHVSSAAEPNKGELLLKWERNCQKRLRPQAILFYWVPD